jgi:hypothetical protein
MGTRYEGPHEPVFRYRIDLKLKEARPDRGKRVLRRLCYPRFNHKSEKGSRQLLRNHGPFCLGHAAIQKYLAAGSRLSIFSFFRKQRAARREAFISKKTCGSECFVVMCSSCIHHAAVSAHSVSEVVYGSFINIGHGKAGYEPDEKSDRFSENSFQGQFIISTRDCSGPHGVSILSVDL